jgi:hypothetical protein
VKSSVGRPSAVAPKGVRITPGVAVTPKGTRVTPCAVVGVLPVVAGIDMQPL